jgi:NAD(P)-dependent dehydrogenase (short-subunit alcohol dehydrogenase family)
MKNDREEQMPHSFQSSLKGNSGILTGGTSGFGFEMVKALCHHGANVAVFSVDEVSEAALAELRQDSIGKVEFYQKDIRASGSSEEMVEQTVKRFGTLDFAIANAGFITRCEEPLLKTPPEQVADALHKQFDVFPIAFATLALAAARAMSPCYRTMEADATGHRSDSGSIIVTLSETVFFPLRDDLIAYAAAKRACLSVMESLAATLGPQNIRVNGVAPGFANTAGPRKFYDRQPRVKADIERKNHLKPSFMHPAAIAAAVLYLLTDNYVTGQVITLDGGYKIELTNYFQGE